MPELNNLITALQSDPTYAEKNFADQYDLHKKEIGRYFYENEEFRSGPIEYQKEAINQKAEETFKPVYENPQAGQWVDSLSQRYLQGDQQARDTMAIFYEKTEVSDKLPFITNLLNQIPDPETAYKYSGIATQDQNGPMALNRTKGGDDNKARKQIEQLFLENNDQGMIEMLTSKSRNREIMAARIGEEAVVAFLGVLTGGAISGSLKAAGVGAKALQSSGRIGAWMATNTPGLAAEAGIEGLRGMADTISRTLRAGEEPTVKGALVSFGAHAALDMAIGHVADGVMGGIRAAKAGYDPELAKQLVDVYGSRVAKGEMPITDIKMPASLSEENFRHMSSINMTRDAYEKIYKGVDPSTLTELEQANIRLYNQGFDVTRLDDGKIFVQPKNDLTNGRAFENTLRAEEWAGSKSSKYLQALQEAGDYDGMATFISRNPQLNYGFARKWADDSWTVRGSKADFTQPYARQYISPVELSNMVENHGEEIVRFSFDPALSPLNVTKGVDGKPVSKTNLFTGNETVTVFPDDNGNAIAFFGTDQKIAGARELEIARNTAELKMKDPTIGKVTSDEIVRDELVRQGFTGARNPDGSMQIFFPDKIKIADPRVNPVTGNIAKTDFTLKSSAEIPTAFIADVGIDASEIAAKPKAFAELGARILAGEVNTTHIRRYADSYLKANGIDKKFRISRNNNGTTTVKVMKNGDVSISLPKSIENLELQKDTFNRLMTGLDNVAGKKRSVPTVASYKAQFTSHQKNYAGTFYSINDFDAYAKTLGDLSSLQGIRKLKDGSYSMRSKLTKKVYKSANANQLLRDIAVNDMDISSFKAALETSGFKVALDGKTINVLGPKGKEVIASGIDQVEIAKTLDYYPQRLPSSMAPKNSFISEVPAMNLVATKNYSSGTAPDLNAFMGNFENYQRILGAEVRVKRNGNTLLKLGKANYEVKIKKLNYTKSFSSEAEAKAFMEGEWKTIASAQEAAQEKGMRLWYENGKFRLRRGNTDIVTKNMDDLYAQLEKFPNPTHARELIPPDVLKAIDELDINLELPPGFGKASMSSSDMAKITNKDWTVFPDTTPGFFDKYGPRVPALRRLSRAIDMKTENKIGLGKLFENLHKDSRIAMGRAHTDGMTLMDIYREGKKIIPQERRVGITHYIEAKANKSANLEDIVKHYGLTDFDTENIAKKLTQFYKDKSDEFGIPFDDMITQYQPHMRKVANEFKEASDNQLITRELISSLPSTRKFMNKKGFEAYALTMERLTDARKAWMDEDSLSVALRYTNAANQKFYAKKSWDDMYDALKVNSKEISGEGYISLMSSYKDALTHPQNVMHKASATKSINKMFHKLGLPAESGTAFLDTLLSLPYMSSMAFRPWLPFRNSFQVLTILPMRTGNIHTSLKAGVNFMKQPKRLMQEMIDEGILIKHGGAQTREYFEMMKGNILANKGPARKFYESAMEVGLKWYGLSDDFTRGVAYMANKDMFDKGMRKGFIGGKLDEAKFLKASRTDGLHPGVQEQVMGFMRQGNYRAAETTMARANIDATMFDYQALNKPLGASGTMGHLFYQFGTYSLNYQQLLATSFRYGSASTKISGFIAMAAGMGAVAQGMKEAGIQNSSFLGYNMVQFNGGPFFGTMVDALEAMSPGIRGQVARRDLMQTIGLKPRADGVEMTWPSLAPGSMQFKYWKKAAKYWEEGDYQGWALAMTTTPEHKSRIE